jgi:hypothetical protein
MDRDRITRTGARAPGVERLVRSHRGVRKRTVPDTEQGITVNAESTKGDGKPNVLGRPRLKFRPLSRTRENRPYGILEGMEETPASSKPG